MDQEFVLSKRDMNSGPLPAFFCDCFYESKEEPLINYEKKAI
jgi:hypothetical protein